MMPEDLGPYLGQLYFWNVQVVPLFPIRVGWPVQRHDRSCAGQGLRHIWAPSGILGQSPR